VRGSRLEEFVVAMLASWIFYFSNAHAELAEVGIFLEID
jgi:hypothetical protein